MVAHPARPNTPHLKPASPTTTPTHNQTSGCKSRAHRHPHPSQPTPTLSQPLISPTAPSHPSHTHSCNSHNSTTFFPTEFAFSQAQGSSLLPQTPAPSPRSPQPTTHSSSVPAPSGAPSPPPSTCGIRPAVVTRSGTTVPGADSRRADLADLDSVTAAVARRLDRLPVRNPPTIAGPRSSPDSRPTPLLAAGTLTPSSSPPRTSTRTEHSPRPHRGPAPHRHHHQGRPARPQLWQELETRPCDGRYRSWPYASDFFGPGVTASAVGERFWSAARRRQSRVGVRRPRPPCTSPYVPDFGEAPRLSETPPTWGRLASQPDHHDPQDLAEQAAAIAGTTARLRPMPRW